MPRRSLRSWLGYGNFPTNASLASDRQGELLGSYLKLARTQFIHGRTEAALDTYGKALVVAERLSAPAALIGSIHDGIGDILAAQGDVAGALASYRAELATTLVNSIDDLPVQRRLSVIYTKIGDAFRTQGEFLQAESHYLSALAISKRLVMEQSGDLDAQWDVALAYGRIGSVFIAQDNQTAAAENYHAALSIAERLAKADPADASRQVDLARAHWALLVLDAPPARPQRLQFVIGTLRELKRKDQLTPEGASLLSSAEELWSIAKGPGENLPSTGEFERARGKRPAIWSRLFSGRSRAK